MIKSSCAELSTLAINNSPLGSESMNTLDDNVRMLGAIMKRGSSIKNATFASGTITLGDEAGTYIVNATSNIASIVGGFTDGIFEILFSNETAVNLEASSTITTSTMLVSKGKSISVTKASTGVFTVVGSNIQLEPRVKVLEGKATAIEAKDVQQDNTLTSHTNSINALAAKDYPHATAGSIGFNTTANNLVNVGALPVVLPENQYGIYMVVVRLNISTDNVNTFLKTVVDRKFLTGLPQPNTVTQSACRFIAPQGSYNETVGEQSFLVSYVSGQNNVMHIGFTGVDASGGNGNGTASGSLTQYAVRLGA